MLLVGPRGLRLSLRLLHCVGRHAGVLAVEQLSDRVRACPLVLGERVRVLRHPLEDREPEELGEDVAPLLRIARQELRELALGQQDRPRERVVVQADQAPHDLVHVADPVGERSGLGGVGGVVVEELAVLLQSGSAAGDVDDDGLGLGA